MAEMPNIDPNFETQSRPRSDTWPMNRPNIPPRRRMPDISGTMLSTTLEENGTGGLMTIDATMMGLDPPPMKDDYLEILSPGSIPVPNDLDNILSGLPSAANLVEDYSLGSALIKNEPNNNSIMSEYCTQTTITELSNLSSDKGFDDIQSMQHQGLAGQLVSSTSQNFSPSTTTTGLPKSPTTSTTVSTPQSLTTSTAGTTPKAKSTRKNAWGNMSYADLITNAIESSPEKRLTLAQIYEWMVKNVNYFKDKGDSNSSAGWKNSIRHNLSLHAKFKRIQNEGTGKSSWWIINHDAKNAKSPRRRAISMDNQNSKHMRQRTKLARQRAEKQKASLKAGETSTWGRDGTSNLETTVSKAMGSEYRVRANSNASSVGGRLSPSHMFPPQDLDDEGPPPLSPLGSATNLANLSTSLPSAFDIFGRTDSTPCTIAESTLPESMVQANLLENFAVMDVGSVSYTGEPVDTKPVLYMQQLNGAQQNQNRKNLTGNVAQNSPNLANLLKQSKSPPKTTTMTKIEPEWNDSKPAYGYEFQSPQMMSSVIQPSQPQFKTPIPPRYVLPQDNTQYSQNALQQQNPVQQQQVNYVQQQQFMANPQRQMVPGNPQQPPPQYPSDTNLIEMAEGNFPSDIDLNSQDLFDSGDLDMAEALRDNDFAYNNFGDINFGNMNQQQVFYNQSQLQGSTDYNMGGNTMMQQQQQPPPVMHANPDVFLANQGPGSTSMDMMMDGCRLNNNNFQRSMQTGQTSSVGAASKYSLQ